MPIQYGPGPKLKINLTIDQQGHGGGWLVERFGSAIFERLDSMKWRIHLIYWGMLPFAISWLIVQRILKVKCSSAGREVVLYLFNIFLVRIKKLAACYSHNILHLQPRHSQCKLLKAIGRKKDWTLAKHCIHDKLPVRSLKISFWLQPSTSASCWVDQSSSVCTNINLVPASGVWLLRRSTE